MNQTNVTFFGPPPGQSTSRLKGEEREEAERGALTLHCPTMDLIAQGASGVRLEGAGTISQQPLGPVAITFYIRQFDLTNLNAVASMGHGEVGKIIPESAYFSIEAIDERNRLWRAHNLLLHGSFQHGAVIRSTTHEIVSSSGSLGNRRAVVTFSPVRLQIPANSSTSTTIEAVEGDSSSHIVDVWDTGHEGYSIAIRKLSHGTRITCIRRSKELPPGLDTRLDETLCFTLGSLTDWTILEANSEDGDETRIRSTPGYTGKMRYIPLPVGMSSSYDRLFRDYLKYVLDGPEGRFHPLSVVWRVVVDASSRTVIEYARAMCVGLETIVTDYFPELMGEPTESIHEIERLSAHVSSVELSKSLRNRVDGFLDNARKPSMGAALNHLVRRGLLTQNQSKSWKKLRNRVAHAMESDFDIEALVVHCDNVYQALVLLTFQVIGYEGQYTDHSTRGYPARQFTPVP